MSNEQACMFTELTSQCHLPHFSWSEVHW